MGGLGRWSVDFYDFTTELADWGGEGFFRTGQFTPLAALDLAAERDKLASELAGVRQELARERAASAVLRRIAAELAIELDQARSEMAASGKVTLLAPRGTRP